MRIHPRLRTVALSVAASGAVALLAAHPAAAQTNLPTATDNQPIVAVRGGLYFPFNSGLKNNSGKTYYGGGLDYILKQKTPDRRTQLSLDYLERSSGGHNVRIIPVTASEFTLQTAQGGVRPYVGIGVGAYFIHQNVLDSSGVNQNTNKVAIGGFFGVGLDLPSNFMLEARYHLIQRVGTYNSSGLQVMGGFRF